MIFGPALNCQVSDVTIRGNKKEVAWFCLLGGQCETTNVVLLQIDAYATGVLACCFDRIFQIILMCFGCPELNRGE